MADDKVKPLLKEYTNASHLLVPNQWYEIRIRVEKGITTYSVNDEELFRYTLAGGEGDGHFGLRLLRFFKRKHPFICYNLRMKEC